MLELWQHYTLTSIGDMKWDLRSFQHPAAARTSDPTALRNKRNEGKKHNNNLSADVAGRNVTTGGASSVNFESSFDFVRDSSSCIKTLKWDCALTEFRLKV